MWYQLLRSTKTNGIAALSPKIIIFTPKYRLQKEVEAEDPNAVDEFIQKLKDGDMTTIIIVSGLHTFQH